MTERLSLYGVWCLYPSSIKASLLRSLLTPSRNLYIEIETCWLIYDKTYALENCEDSSRKPFCCWVSVSPSAGLSQYLSGLVSMVFRTKQICGCCLISLCLMCPNLISIHSFIIFQAKGPFEMHGPLTNGSAHLDYIKHTFFLPSHSKKKCYLVTTFQRDEPKA